MPMMMEAQRHYDSSLVAEKRSGRRLRLGACRENEKDKSREKRPYDQEFV
jgi:hypothetical protein